MRAVYRYEVPVDDEAHEIELSGLIVHVASRVITVVDVWAESDREAPIVRTFRVFATGQPLPHQAVHIGTVLAGRDGVLVWHLYELLVGDAS